MRGERREGVSKMFICLLKFDGYWWCGEGGLKEGE